MSESAIAPRAMLPVTAKLRGVTSVGFVGFLSSRHSAAAARLYLFRHVLYETVHLGLPKVFILKKKKKKVI